MPAQYLGRWRGRMLATLSALTALAGAALLSAPAWSAGAPTEAPEVDRNLPVTATDHLRQPANNSPVVIADPTDGEVLVLANRVDAPDFGCALHVSGDGGRTWVPSDPVPQLPVGAEKCYAPEVAFDGNGVLYFIFIGLQGQGNEPMGAFLATSLDQGRSFSSPRQVLGPLNFAVRMAIDQTMGERGRIHLVWLQANADPPLGGFPSGPNPILAAHSDDGGATFSEPVEVSDPDRLRVVAPALALGPDHAVHVAYYDLQDDARDYHGLEGPVWEGNWSVVVATSLDGGIRYEPGVVVDSEIVPPERPILIFTMAPPALAAGQEGVCSAWTDARHGDADVLARCSSREVSEWGPLRRVNDDPLGNGIRQYLPRLSMAPGGRVDAVYLDRRHHPDNSRNDVSYTYSDDGGRSFASSQTLTETSSSPLIGQRYVGPAAEGQVEIGARLGLLSHSSGVVAAWPDTRFSIAPHPVRTGQDIFVAEVRIPGSGSRGWGRALGVVLLAVGTLSAIALLLGRRRLDPPRRLSDKEGLPAASASSPPAGAQASLVPGGWRRRHVLPVALGVLAAMAMVAVLAAGQRGDSAAAADLVPHVVDVAMTEYQFALEPPPTESGRTVLQVRNAGQELHKFDLVLLPDDMPPLDVHLKGQQRRLVTPYLELPPARPGQVQTVAVDLVAGQRYGVVCVLETPEGDAHLRLGMNAEFKPQ